MQLESLQFRYMPLVDTRELPKPLTNLFLDVYLELKYEELLDKCEDVVSNVLLTYLQKYICQQCLSKIWFQQRAGRITASKLKQAMETNLEKPSQSLIVQYVIQTVLVLQQRQQCMDANMKKMPKRCM